MDRTVIQVDKLNRLYNIANLSAALTVETDNYIRLAIAVEQYIKDPNQSTYDDVSNALETCGKRHPMFSGMREQMMSMLISNGNLRRMDTHTEEPFEEPKTFASEPVQEEPIVNKPTIVNLADFRKKKVDKPE